MNSKFGGIAGWPDTGSTLAGPALLTTLMRRKRDL